MVKSRFVPSMTGILGLQNAKLSYSRLISVLICIVVIIGALIRAWLIVNKGIHPDEIANFKVATDNSVYDIVSYHHWIKNHGNLYYLWLKAWSLLSWNIHYLRFTNLAFYLVSCIAMYISFNKKNLNIILAVIVLLSFNRYFIYLNALVSSYNLVFFLFVILLDLLLMVLGKSYIYGSEKFHYFLMILSAIMGFYTDYSFIYTGIFCLTVLFFSYSDKNIFRKLLLSGTIILVGIVPGLVQLFVNLGNIRILSMRTYIQDAGILKGSQTIGQSVFFSGAWQIGYLIFGLCSLILIKNYYSDSNENTNRLGMFALLSMTISILFVTAVSRLFFFLLIGRSFWFFQFAYIILLSACLVTAHKHLSYVTTFLVVLITSLNLMNKNPTILVRGDITQEVAYHTLVDKIIDLPFNHQNIIIIGRVGLAYPLRHYYFSERYPLSEYKAKQLTKLRINANFTYIDFTSKSSMTKKLNHNLRSEMTNIVVNLEEDFSDELLEIVVNEKPVFPLIVYSAKGKLIKDKIVFYKLFERT